MELEVKVELLAPLYCSPLTCCNYPSHLSPYLLPTRGWRRQVPTTATSTTTPQLTHKASATYTSHKSVIRGVLAPALLQDAAGNLLEPPLQPLHLPLALLLALTGAPLRRAKRPEFHLARVRLLVQRLVGLAQPLDVLTRVPERQQLEQGGGRMRAVERRPHCARRPGPRPAS